MGCHTFAVARKERVDGFAINWMVLLYRIIFMDEFTEQRIVEGLRRGDEETWFAFYDATAPRLWRPVRDTARNGRLSLSRNRRGALAFGPAPSE